MKTPPKERVGKELNGLTIIIEGTDRQLVSSVIDKVADLLPKESNIKRDQSFDNQGEKVLRDTIELYHTVRAPIDPKTLSLLYVVSYSKRLELIKQAKLKGSISLISHSWLQDYRALMETNQLEAASHLLDMCISIKPDVWIVVDRRTRNYKRLQSLSEVRFISSTKPIEEIVLKAYEHIVQAGRSASQKKTQTPPLQITQKKIETSSKTTLEPTLSSKVKQGFDTIYDKLRSNHAYIKESLASKRLPLQLANYVQPFADFGVAYNLQTTPFEDTYEPATASAVVRTAAPRNEMEIAKTVAFTSSQSDYSTVEARVDAMSYEEKADLVSSSILNQRMAGPPATYTFWLVCPLMDILQMRLQLPNNLIAYQTPSPLLGYSIPSEMMECRLDDTFQQSFDLCVDLFSLLQAAGAYNMAYFATLGGHYVRAEATLSTQDIITMQEYVTSQTYSMLLRAVKDIHPLIGTSLEKIVLLKNRK